MDLKEKNVKSIFDEIGFMNNKRLGRCFQTRRKKYYFDTGTGKVFEVNSNVYYILQKILDNADKEDLLNDSDVTVEALNEVYSSIMQENILKAPVLEGFIGSQITDLEGQLTKHRAQITLELSVLNAVVVAHLQHIVLETLNKLFGQLENQVRLNNRVFSVKVI